MMEYWNTGIMGSGKMEIWSNGKTVLDIEFNNVKRKKFLLRINPAREGILNIPIFHYSIVPYTTQNPSPR